MKTKLNIAMLLLAAIISVTACQEESITPTGSDNTQVEFATGEQVR